MIRKERVVDYRLLTKDLSVYCKCSFVSMCLWNMYLYLSDIVNFFLRTIFPSFIYNSNENWITLNHIESSFSVKKYCGGCDALLLFCFVCMQIIWIKLNFFYGDCKLRTKKKHEIKDDLCVNVWMNEWTLWHHLTVRLRLRSSERILCKIFSRYCYYFECRCLPKKKCCKFFFIAEICMIVISSEQKGIVAIVSFEEILFVLFYWNSGKWSIENSRTKKQNGLHWKDWK